MAHFKRRRAKKQVRCTMCTKYRWLGNSKSRKRVRELRQIERTASEIRGE